MHRTAAVALVACLGLVAATAAAGANPGPTFGDAWGDASGAPDITSVVVTTGPTGVVFTIHTVSAAAWENAAAILSVDTDANPQTGDAGGATGYELSYVLHSLHTELTLDRGAGLPPDQHPAATWALGGATLTITVPFSELGTSPRIAFSVSTPAPSGSDRAPDAGEWQLSPGATATALAARFTPGAPVHGKAFALRGLTISFSDSTTGTASAACTATLAGARLAGGCRWRLAASSRGKTLLVTVRAAGLRKAYRFRVG